MPNETCYNRMESIPLRLMGRHKPQELLARSTIFLIAGSLLVGCDSNKPMPKQELHLSAPIQIQIDLKDPSRSFGVLPVGEQRRLFKVGYGRHGVTCAGTQFEEGYTPLGRFVVNAILSKDQFAMDKDLIVRSGKSEKELRKTLFANMNSIDFSGDGESGEYGIGYISLAPINSVKQPFSFNKYNGTFRWYSFAMHGSNNEAKVGDRVTGGCLNLGESVLASMLKIVRLGDTVEIRSNGSCTP